jgi:hypothetical protein
MCLIHDRPRCPGVAMFPTIAGKCKSRKSAEEARPTRIRMTLHPLANPVRHLTLSLPIGWRMIYALLARKRPGLAGIARPCSSVHPSLAIDP